MNNTKKLNKVNTYPQINKNNKFLYLSLYEYSKHSNSRHDERKRSQIYVLKFNRNSFQKIASHIKSNYYNNHKDGKFIKHCAITKHYCFIRIVMSKYYSADYDWSGWSNGI